LYGTILKTGDGGMSWTPRLPGISQAIRGVVTLDSRHAVAVGDQGIVLRSDDGGDSWSKLSDSSANLNGVLLLGQGRLLAVGSQIRLSVDGGQSWQQVPALSTSLSFNAAALAADGSIYTVGPYGIIARGTDGGRLWLPISSPRLHAMAFAGARHGIVVGDFGTIIGTTDGGRTWSAEDSHVSRSLLAVALSGTDHAVAVGEQGTMLISRGAGEDWIGRQGGTGDLLDVTFADDRHAFAVGLGAPVLESADGAVTWSARREFTQGGRSIAFLDRQHGFLVPVDDKSFLWTTDAGSAWSSGSLPEAVKLIPLVRRVPLTRGQSGEYALVTRDDQLKTHNGTEWVPLSIAAQPLLKQVSAASFGDADHGIALGQAGTALRSEDGGKTWTGVAGFTTLNLTGIRFTNESHAVAIAQGRVFLTSDAGQTWAPVSYQRYPSPWLWIATLGLLAVPVVVFRRRSSASAAIEAPPSVTDAAVSDSPIGWRDPDALGLKEIARGLSRFIRNQRTQPPLTIGITGEWGSGKSSLMNLLKEDLQRYGFRPVWFNAWHHQSGENLLASLLSNIHAQGIPSWLTLAGIDFRMSLLEVRLRRFWLRLSITLLALIIAFYTYDILGMNAVKLWQTLTSNGPLSLEHLGAATGLLSLIAAAVTPIVAAIRVVSAFGLRPGKLIASVATMHDDETAHLQPGARYRFAREFHDFACALEPRTLVIFIDDLDRCRPANVIEVLEAVNFLISSGPCVVVLGMARRWVEACVGQAFQELATAGADAPSDEAPRPDSTTTPPAEEANREQRQFARNYLEKLLNIEVRIPKLTEQAAETVLRSGDVVLQDDHVRVRRFLARVAPVAAVLVVAGCIYWIGYEASKGLQELNSVIEAHTAASQTPAVTTVPSLAAANLTHAAGQVVAPASERDDGPADVEAPSAPVSAGWYLGAGLPALLGVCALIAVILLVRRQVRTDDSQNFRRALAVLRPWILLGGDSPRSLKRFLNSLRYIAMRFRQEVDPPTLWERSLDRAQRLFSGEPLQSTPVPPRVLLEEPLLVALAAIYRCKESWLDVRKRMLDISTIDSLLIHDMPDRFADVLERKRAAARLVNSLTEFNAAFPNTPLFQDEMQDRRYFVAFCDVVAMQAAEPEPLRPETPSPPVQLRPT
jgi:photosystem II stability/assembly factor-like uncharacterized protein